MKGDTWAKRWPCTCHSEDQIPLIPCKANSATGSHPWWSWSNSQTSFLWVQGHWDEMGMWGILEGEVGVRVWLDGEEQQGLVYWSAINHVKSPWLYFDIPCTKSSPRQLSACSSFGHMSYSELSCIYLDQPVHLFFLETSSVLPSISVGIILLPFLRCFLLIEWRLPGIEGAKAGNQPKLATYTPRWPCKKNKSGSQGCNYAELQQ